MVSSTETRAELSATPKSTAETVQDVYTLEIAAESVGDGRIRVHGTSNLPSGSALVIDVVRLVIDTSTRTERYWYAGGVAYQPTRVTLTNETFSADVMVQDESLVEFFRTAPGLAKTAGIRCEDCSLRALPDVAVAVLFDPKEQRSSVAGIVGKRGERLASSPQLYVFGSRTATPTNQLKVEIRVPLAFPDARYLVAD